MKPSMKCKNAGLVSLKELSNMTDKSAQTLINWNRYSTKLFDIIVLGAGIMKGRK